LFFQEAPKVEEAPKDVTVQEGEAANFTCQLAAPSCMPPYPQVCWYFEGSPIDTSDIYVVECNVASGVYSLHLPECFPEDSGVYTVRATNSHGIIECNATLTVRGEFAVISNILV